MKHINSIKINMLCTDYYNGSNCQHRGRMAWFVSFFLSEYNIYNNKISQHEEYQVVWGFLVWQI